MYCTKCGAKCNDGDSFCLKCGANLNAVVETVVSNPVANSRNIAVQSGRNIYSATTNNYAVRNQQSSRVSSTRISYFDGNGFQYAGYCLLTFLLSVVTLGFGVPWACCLLIRWETSHTVINGKRLYFNGSAGQLFGKMILWALIIIGAIGTPILLAYSFSYTGGYFNFYAFAKWFPFIIINGLFVIVFGNSFYYVYIKKWVIYHTVFSDNVMNVNGAVNGASISTPPAKVNYAAQVNNYKYSNSVNKIPPADITSANKETSYESRPMSASESHSQIKTDVPDNYDISQNDNYTASDKQQNTVNTNDESYSDEKIYCPVCSAEIPYGISSCPNCGSEFRWDE